MSAQINLFSKIGFLEKVLFTRHLATMMKAGVPLLEALQTLIEGTKSSAFRKVLEGVAKKVENGQSLAKALQTYPKVFDHFYCGLIEVGEESGSLDENLDFLADQLSKSYSLKKKIQGAMLYPGLVFSATLVMGGFIAFYILPKLADFFSAFEVELPLATKILLFVANGLKDYGGFLLVGLLILVLFLIFLFRFRKVKFIIHQLMLKLPLIGKIVLDEQLARFSRNLGVMLKCGVPIARSLEITSETLSNLKFKQDLGKITLTLKEGKSIGEVLKKNGFWEFPPLVGKMITVGEKTGKLEEVLLYLAGFYEEEIDDSAKNLNTILEPILLIGIGLIVAFVALAIISPIYELTGSIRK